MPCTGIDTSNYKTSVAVTDSSGSIVCDRREFLRGEEQVKEDSDSQTRGSSSAGERLPVPEWNV